MTKIITLITPKNEQAISDNLILKIKQIVGQDFVAAYWLGQDEALEILLNNDIQQDAREEIIFTIRNQPIDYAFLDDDNRRKKLLIADMDSTMIGQECIDELAAFINIKDKVSDITERSMRGELEFEDSLRERVALLKDLPESALQSVFSESISLNQGAKTLVQTMKANNAYTALVSGGFTYFTDRVQKLLGYDTTRANVLNFVDGKLNGSVIEPILGQQAKLDAMNDYCQQQNINLSDCLAVGDGANDLAMITKAGLGVAYHAKPLVAQQAKVAINYCDLTTLLYIQGYKSSEFVG